MNIQEAFLLYTILNMQNSQLPCFIPSISLKPFPYLAHSICHFFLLAAPTLHSTVLPCYASHILFLPLPSSSAFCCFSKYFSSFSSFPTSSISTCPLQPSSHPCIHLFPPLSLLFFSLSLQCESSTCDTLLPVSSHLNGMCGLAISDSSQQEVRANLSPTSTPHRRLLFVFITQICYPLSQHTSQTFNISTLADKTK